MREYPKPQEHRVRFFELSLRVERVGEFKSSSDWRGLSALIATDIVLEVISIVPIPFCRRSFTLLENTENRSLRKCERMAG
jgi:hypothetical protein